MTETELAEKIGALTSKLSEAVAAMDESRESDTDRWQKANDERKTIAEQLQLLMEEKQKHDREAETAKAREDMEQLLSGVRAASKAGAIGNFRSGADGADQYAGFIKQVYLAGSRDISQQAAAKAYLEGIGSRYQTPEEAGSKATLGATDATGGYIIPNNLVEALMKPKVQDNIYMRLCNVVSGVRGSGVDQPFRQAAPLKAVIAPWGDQKEKRDLDYNNYTATLYTIAAIYDIGKQFLRQSEGAAQQDVLGELGSAFALGEADYILNGTGTSQPFGLLTAIGTAGTYVTAHTPSASTVAGNFAAAVAKAAGALAGRSRSDNLTAVVNATSYWTLLTAGDNTAGFYIAPSTGPMGVNASGNASSAMSVFGVPIIPDPNMPADSLVVGQWKALKIYTGEGYRVDSTDVAGERWDRNLVGFRGEEEIGLDARPAVYTGAFQRITDVLP